MNDNKFILWRMGNNKEFLDGAPLWNAEINHLDFHDENDEGEVLAGGFKVGHALKATGHIDLLWFPEESGANFLFLNFPIATQAIAEIIQSLVPGDVQLFPAFYKGHENKYVELNFTRSILCLDEQESEVTYHHHVKDAKMALIKPVIDVRKVGEAKMFRLADHLSTLVVTEEIRQSLLHASVVGPTFYPLLTSHNNE